MIPRSSSGNSQEDLPAQVEDCIIQAKGYLTIAVEDIIKPSIKKFLETCDPNPRVAATVAAPALLSFFLALVFFALSTLVVILWSLLSITIGVTFVIIGGLISLFFKLLMVLLATVPMAGIAAALRAGANVALQFIIKKALSVLHKYEDTTTSTGAIRQEWSLHDPRELDGEYSPVVIDKELDTGSVLIGAESSAEGLKRRTPFPSVGEDETE